MPTVITHAGVALALGSLWGARPVPRRFWAACAVCSVLPDADVIGLYLGIPYDHPLGHRGLSHSLPFALAVGAVAAFWVSRAPLQLPLSRLTLTLVLSAITASHGILDALTDGGLGIAFLAPFDNARHFFPWQPIPVSPLGARALLSPYGAQVLLSEATWLGLPSLALLLLTRRWSSN